MIRRAAALWFALAAAVLGCDFDWTSMLAAGSAESDPAISAHVLDRVTYGADPWTRSRIDALGVEGFIEEQLRPETIPDSAWQARELAYPSLGRSYRELRTTTDGEVVEETMRLCVERAIASHRQLEAVLTEFWSDHFNVYALGGLAPWDLPRYENEAIRPYVLGRFEDMLVAVARSPAMLRYLDNDLSYLLGVNENYARELLELHTVGVDGGYLESDVVDLARVLTGWSVDWDGTTSDDGFVYRPDWHDTGPKNVLGLAFGSGGGEEEGLAALHHLATRPSTARFLARKLARRFVSEDPPEALVERVAQKFLATGGDLYETTRELLLSSEFRNAERRGKVKRPFRLAVSLARALQLDGPFVTTMVLHDTNQLGQPLYQWTPPNGYPDDSRHWVGAGTIVQRFEFAQAAAYGGRGEHGLAQGGGSAALFDRAREALFIDAVSPTTRQVVLDHLDSLGAYRDYFGIQEALVMLIASPEFLLH